jgi:hypothetical protein
LEELRKKLIPAYSAEYVGRLKIQLSEAHLKNKTVVIYTKNNFNITIWIRKMPYDYIL